MFFSPDRVQAQVLYDFIAEPGNNELTVKEGETVTITNQVNLYQNSSSAFLLPLLELHLRNIVVPFLDCLLTQKCTFTNINDEQTLIFKEAGTSKCLTLSLEKKKKRL